MISYKCPVCGSTNTEVQTFTYEYVHTRGCLYWLLFGWVVDVIKALIFPLWVLFLDASRPPSSDEAVIKFVVCQNCARHWRLK